MGISKTFKVIMLPGVEKTCIRGDIFMYQNKLEISQTGNDYCPYYLYIISDDEIKDGRTNFYTHDNLNHKVCHVDYIKYFGSENNGKGDVRNGRASFKTVEGTNSGTSHKEIIATSDTSLNLPQLPESFIQAYIKAYDEGKPITEVDLEMEPTKLYVAPENLAQYQSQPTELQFPHSSDENETWGIKTRPDNTVITHLKITINQI